MIKPPKIDSRTQSDLVELIKDLMVNYCHDYGWTDKALIKSGQFDETLIQIFARMMDIAIQRLNRVPDKNFLTFLDLMGIRLSLPHVARAPLSFTMSKGTSRYGFVPAGTQVAGENEDKEEVVFETDQDLTIILPKLVKAISIDPQNDRYTDHSTALLDAAQSQEESLFTGRDLIPHRIFFGHDTLFGFKEPSTIKLEITLRKELELSDWEVKWYYYSDDSEEPVLLTPNNTDTANLLSSGSVIFTNVSGVSEKVLAGFDKTTGLEKSWKYFWIYAELSKPIPQGQLPEILSAQASITVQQAEATKPDLAFFKDAGTDKYISVDLKRAFYPFGNKPGLEDAFYIGFYDVFSKEGTTITILIRLAALIRAFISNIKLSVKLRWEFYDGEKWLKIGETGVQGVTDAGDYSFKDSTNAFTQSGEVEFTCPAVNACTVNGEENYWVRVSIIRGAYVIKLPPYINGFDIKYVVPIAADLAFFNNLPIDLTKDFSPFGEKPRFNDTFYIGSEEVFAKKGASVTISATLSDTGPPNTTDIKLVWEFYDGDKWMKIGETSNAGVSEAEGRYSFTDSTNAFTQSGEVKFTCPDVNACTVNGEENYWIRVRIIGGNYGEEATYQEQTVDGKYKVIMDGGVKKKIVNGVKTDLAAKADGMVEETEWIYVPATYKWPSVKILVMEYELTTAFKNLKTVLTYNDFLYQDQTEACNAEEEYFPPFEATADQDPALYLAIDQDISTLPVNMFFPLERTLSTATLTTQTQTPPIVAWEYWNGESWSILSVKDETINMTKREMIQFQSPDDVAALVCFAKEYYWVRVRIEAGGYSLYPRLKAIYTNTVWSHNLITCSDEVLGSGNGKPGQAFQFAHHPVLSGQEILVRETALTDEEKEVITSEEGEDAFTEVTDEAENVIAIWIRWHETANFYFSGPGSRHYLLDRNTGVITFGDGVRGMIPPAGKNNITCSRYQYGGGLKGNIGAGTLTKLRTTFPYIDSVTNPVDAEGGCDTEDLDHVRVRGPQTIKNRQRAVTYEDFEWLVREASPKIALVKCLPTTDTGLKFKPGWITIILVPDSDEAKPLPSQELLGEIEEYLFARTSTYLTIDPSQVNFLGPGYIKIGTRATVAYTSLNQAKIIEGRILDALNTFFHPLKGGSEQNGWGFGRDVHISEVYEVIEKVDGVDYVSDLTLKAAVQIYALQPITEHKSSYTFPVGSEVKTLDNKICFSLAEEIVVNAEVNAIQVTGFKEGDVIILSNDDNNIDLVVDSVEGDVLECTPLQSLTDEISFPQGSLVTTSDNTIWSFTLNEVITQSDSFYLKVGVFEAGDSCILYYQEHSDAFEIKGVSGRPETVFIEDHYLVYSGSHAVNKTVEDELIFPYVVNLNTLELHDLGNENTNCQIAEIRRENRQYLRTIDKDYLEQKNIDYCRWCFGREMSKR